MYLSVVIPAYNEAKCIGGTLDLVSEYLSRQDYKSEIIVVNDGSLDGTKGIVLTYQRKILNLKLLDIKVNRGKGWAVRQGMLEAYGDYRLFMDADSSTTIEQIEYFWPHLKTGYDIVIGSIEVPGAKINGHGAWYRRPLGIISRYIVRIGTGIWEIQDTQRGFKLFRAEVVKKIFPLLTIARFGFDIEVIVLARKFGFKIKEVPVAWNNGTQSSVYFGSYISTFLELLRIIYYTKMRRYQERKIRS